LGVNKSLVRIIEKIYRKRNLYYYKELITVKFYQFPVEKSYDYLLRSFFIAFITISIVTVWLIVFWSFSGMYILISYIIGLVILGAIITLVEAEHKNQLEIKYVSANPHNRLIRLPGTFGYDHWNTYSIACPYCNRLMELDRSLMISVPKFGGGHPICIHYRGLTVSSDGKGHAKFAIPKFMSLE
jgi:hypothetical protein